MKIENLIETVCSGNRTQIISAGAASAVFFAGDTQVLEFGRIKTGGFDEALGLPEKLRRHAANDRLSVEADSENVIPFGCEYRVKRHWKLAGNVWELTCDVAADNGGRITNLELEELVFPIANAKVEYLVYGENSLRCDTGYDGSEMILMLRVTAPDGTQVEFYAGDDIWRHRAAAGIEGAEAHHKLTVNACEVRYTRQVLAFQEDIIPEKRPWRFKSLIAVSSAGKRKKADTSLEIKSCFASGCMHRDFRNFIRRLPDGCGAGITGHFPVLCNDGSHQSRPGREVAHGDLTELFNEWVWASGVLAKKNGFCTVETCNKLFIDSVILANMAKHPEQIVFGDEK